jgi:hypothetical protein
VITSQDPEFKQLKENLDNGHELLKESVSFLQKQAEDSHKKLVGCHWKAIREELEARNLLPADYSEEKYALEFDDGVLYLKEKGKKDFGSFVEMLFDHFNK